MVPLLQVLSDGAQRTRREAFAAAAVMMHLPPDQQSQTLKSGQSTADNRAGWALSFLTRAEAVGRPRRGEYVITPVGRNLLAQHPGGLTEKHLTAIPAYRNYVAAPRTPPSSTGSAAPVTTSALDPVEQIEEGYNRVAAAVAADLLKRLREQEPAFLERSVLDVLMKMGYGGTDGQARHIGGTGDGGVDGVIDQDKLGLQRIYVQAKRYAADNTVGREAIQAFVGALHGRNVSQGIFITTSRFSTGALDYASTIGTRVVLIDGPRFAELMITYGVGVQPTSTYTVVALDEDYFE